MNNAKYHNLLQAFHLKPLDVPIYVTRPRMPSREAYNEKLDVLWESKWLTNKGTFHQELEAKLKRFVNRGEVTLVANGTLSILLALKAAGVEKGASIVTTPFTFPATTHAVEWLGCRPIFADIDPVSGNICPQSVKDRIEGDTQAILAVHVYGTPCDDDALSAFGIPVVYDAAHAFGAEYNGRSLLTYGRASSTSFHATKLFSSVEGGAVFVPGEADKERIDRMRNFGILSESEVTMSGLNMKMSEFHAAFGLLAFEEVHHEIEERGEIASRYIEGLRDVEGVEIVTAGKGFTPNWSYFVIRIMPQDSGFDRDELHHFLQSLNINCRRYFRPLTSRIPTYKAEPTALDEMLPNAVRMEQEVLCLPMYGELDFEQVDLILRAIKALKSL